MATFASIKFVPESPRYYVASGRNDKAENILKKIALTNKTSLPPGRLFDINARVSYSCSLFKNVSFLD